MTGTDVSFHVSRRFAHIIAAWCKDFAAMQDAGWAQKYPEETRIVRTILQAVLRALGEARP